MPGTTAQDDRHFRFLRKLRGEGRTNMYGAVPYLMRAFAIDREEAFAIVCRWLDQQQDATVTQEVTSKPAARKAGRPQAA